MKHPQLHTIRHELDEALRILYGNRLVRLVLYGSQAREDAVPGSDIDVLVVLKGPVRSGQEIERTSDIVCALSLKYDVVISRVFKSEEAYQQEQSPLLLNIRKEGVRL